MTDSMSGVARIRQDLIDQQNDLDGCVAELSDSQWGHATLSPRWSVADQIGHLAYFDNTAALAILKPGDFSTHVAELTTSMTDPLAVDEATLGSFRTMTPTDLLDSWRQARSTLASASATLSNDDRVVWYGPSMGSKSFLTARLMECWAHGLDVCDATGQAVEHSDRIQHIARLGFITRGWSYMNRKLDVPSEPVRVELQAPSGGTWAFGNDDATESVVGSAVDFCMVITQRRHVDDTELAVTGDSAAEWMRIAQAFAGPPTDGPAPTG